MATRALNPRRPAARARRSRGRARTTPAARGSVFRRRAIAAAVLLLALYGGYMLWFRDLSWFAVNDVSVKGATTNERQIQQALEQVSGGMTTLHLNDDQLREAVSRFPTVASVSASTSFPHGLTVTITERLPVAYVRIHGQDTAVSADGYLLPGLDFDSQQMPRIDGAGANGSRLDGDAAAQAAIVGATPGSLRELITSSSWSEDDGGVVVELQNGPEVRFGDGSRPADKWSAAVAVLSGSERGSPSYLDVSVPDRPVSGG